MPTQRSPQSNNNNNNNNISLASNVQHTPTTNTDNTTNYYPLFNTHESTTQPIKRKRPLDSELNNSQPMEPSMNDILDAIRSSNQSQLSSIADLKADISSINTKIDNVSQRLDVVESQLSDQLLVNTNLESRISNSVRLINELHQDKLAAVMDIVGW